MTNNTQPADIVGNEVMVDLETMGSGPNAAIIAIGAVRFNVSRGVTDTFYTVVDLADSVREGLEIDPATVLWWLGQSDQARAQFKQKGLTLGDALDKFAAWLGDRAEVWGNGAAFDNVILANAYTKTGRAVPWRFWNDRCYRTMKSLHPAVKLHRLGDHHNALDDARSQAEHLIEIFRRSAVTIGGSMVSGQYATA